MFNEVVNNDSTTRFVQVTNDINDAPFSSVLKQLLMAVTMQHICYMIKLKWIYW